MANIFCDMFMNATQSDISIVNIGMLRVDWPTGFIDYQKLFETIPFTNILVKVTLTGAILK